MTSDYQFCQTDKNFHFQSWNLLLVLFVKIVLRLEFTPCADSKIVEKLLASNLLNSQH